MSIPENNEGTQPASEEQSQPEASVENATGRDGDANATEGFEVEDASAAPPDDPDTLNQGDAIGEAGHTGSAPPDEAADAPVEGVPVFLFESDQQDTGMPADDAADEPIDGTPVEISDSEQNAEAESPDDESEPPADDSGAGSEEVIAFDTDSGLVIGASGSASDDEISFIDSDSEAIEVVAIGDTREAPEEGNADSGDEAPEISIVNIGIANPSIGRPLPVEAIGRVRLPVEIDTDDEDSVPAPDEIERPVVDEQPNPALFGGLPSPGPRPGIGGRSLAPESSQEPAMKPGVGDVLPQSRPGINFPDETNLAGSAEPPAQDTLDVFVDPRPLPQRPSSISKEPVKEVSSTEESEEAGLPPLIFQSPGRREFGQRGAEATETETETPEIEISNPAREFGPGPRQAFSFDDGLETQFTIGISGGRGSDFESTDDSADEDEADDFDI